MGDVFKEQIVKRKQTGMDSLKRVGLVVAMIIVFIIALVVVPYIAPGLAFLTPVLILLAGFGAFFLNGLLKVEYEYIFTNGELDIDIIYNRSRRKRAFSSHVNKFDIMAHVEDMTHAGAFHGAQETKDFSSGAVGENTYAFLVNYNSKRTKVIIEPNEKMMDAMKGSISRSKLHLKR